MTDWEGMWKAGDTPWDRGAPAPPLIELLSMEEGTFLKGARVLVPGCGSGEDVRELARNGAHALGLDLSPSAVEVARRTHPTEGASFECGNFFDWEEGPYDAVWEHTCFCAIQPDDRPLHVEACARLIRPGGHLAAVFYLEPWADGEVPDPPPFGVSRSEILDLFGRHFELRMEKVPDLAFPGREGREWLVVFERVLRDRGVADLSQTL